MTDYDLILRSGTIYDGSGGDPYTGDVAIQGDTIAAVGDLGDAKAAQEIEVHGLAVAPGFINMLSWSNESLIEDGRSQSEIRQGVTLEVMGEGTSMGPLSEEMRAARTRGILGNTRIHYEIEWNTLGEYLEWLEKRGVSTNIASFVGTGTLRVHAIGYDDREPTEAEIEQMRALIRQAMEEGAVGMSAALIYPPASYANTDELIELAAVVAEYDGLYISHIRNEASSLLDALEELVEIADVAHVRAEIYHLKSAGPENWGMIDDAIQLIEAAQADGLPITADMYMYPYSGTGLSSCIPPWAHEGGEDKLRERLKDPATRERIKQEMLTPSYEWENMYQQNGADKIMLCGFRTDELKPLTGKTLAEISAMRGTPPEDTLMDLLVEDESRIFTIYFTMSEDNVRKQMALPWVSFCSDAESQAPEGVFLESNPHPRAYGSFARVLGKYVRDEGVLTLQDAVRRLTSFPAANLKIEGRGSLEAGYYADVVVFDPAKVQDHATPEKPHQYATGMQHVFVNGVQVLKDGDHTGAKPGRVVRGPGYGKKPFEGSYPVALHPLLTLGGDYNDFYDGFNLGKQYIPDLIRMATDARLHTADPESPLAFAPVHAARRLAMLGAKEAIEPLVKQLAGISPNVIMNFPDVFAAYGKVAIPALVAYLTNPFNMDFSRIGAAVSLRQIALMSGDNTTYLIIESILIEQLKKYADESIALNSGLVNALVSMESDAAVDLIVEVYRDGMILPGLAPSWQDVRIGLGLPASFPNPLGEDAPEDWDDVDDAIDSDFDDNEDDLTARPIRKDKADAKKKKAKRKQTDKMKKLQRKKKR
ncbi:MAG: D-aminoacylase [Chloroflexota bacterium]